MNRFVLILALFCVTQVQAQTVCLDTDNGKFVLCDDLTGFCDSVIKGKFNRTIYCFNPDSLNKITGINWYKQFPNGGRIKDSIRDLGMIIYPYILYKYQFPFRKHLRAVAKDTAKAYNKKYEVIKMKSFYNKREEQIDSCLQYQKRILYKQKRDTKVNECIDPYLGKFVKNKFNDK